MRVKPEMNIRHLRYFVALARERHHARAAAACHVTQPTLSEAIRQLERELAVPLIYREGQRFGGLTAEGERALDWARRILADQEALEQELAEMRVGLTGDLHFGVIPAAMPATPWVTAAFCRNHPLVTLKVLSLSSIEIQRGLDAAELDAGLTYLDNELALANVTDYSLAAAVWTNDIDRGHYVSRHLDAGTVWINTYGPTDTRLPWGGMGGQSGFGRDLGRAALENYTEQKTVWLQMRPQGAAA